MPKPIRTSNGRFNGSIGDGKNNPPKTIKIPHKEIDTPARLTDIETLYQKTKQWKPSLSEIRQYTESDCWILAQELHSLTGWSYAAIRDTAEDVNGNPSTSEKDTVRYGWVHLGLSTPDGKFLDIRGIQSPSEALNHWDMLQAETYECELVITIIPCHEVENKLSLKTLDKTDQQVDKAAKVAKNMFKKEETKTKCLGCKN